MTWRARLFLLLAGIAGFGHAPAALAAICNSTGTNTWNNIATWSCGVVPAAGDVVTILLGHTVTVDTNTNNLASLTVAGILTLGNNGTGRTITVAGDITVSGTLSVGATAATHTLLAGGNIINTGTINLQPSATRVCNVTFNRNGNQTVSGAGASTFNLITLNMGATRANILDMQSAMTVPSPFLTITNGTYKHSNTSNITPWTADPNIPATGGFWLNAAATVTTSGFNVTINGGQFRISAGTMTIGNANNTLLVLNNAATTLFQMDGGALTVTGGINSSTNAAAGIFTMSGGTMTLMSVSAGAVYTLLLGSATTLNWSGGTIFAINGNAAQDDIDIRSATQNITGGTLQIGSAATTSTNDISYINGAGGVLNVWNLVLASGPARNILMRSSTNILNDLTITALNNLAPSAGIAINVGAGNTSGNWTNNGTFTQSTTTVNFTGTSAAPVVGGTTLTTFYNLTINKASNDLTINTTPTVSNLLTFTSGRIVTGANRVDLGTAATIATPGASSYVVGALRKNYSAGANLGYFAGNDFPVGSATSYTPIDITAGTTTTAGSLTVTTTSTDHPQVTTPIASTGIDATKSVNRYWTLNNAGLTVGTAISSTFTFVGGDIDAGAAPANFIVQRYDGANWNPTTLVAANALNTQASNITTLVVGNNDFAIGEPLPGIASVPGRFNAFETSTPANSLLGRIYTKLVGVPFSLDIISINAAKTAYGGAVATVTVQLLDSSNNSGVPDVNGCRPTWVVVQCLAGAAVGCGQAAINIPAGGRLTLNNMTVPKAYPDARLQISSAGPLVGCSTDRFAIRPQSFTVTSTNANITSTTGTPGIKTGANFNLTAASVAGYNGTPSIDNTQVVGTPTAGAIGGAFGAALVGTGTATGASFFYSEVGNFGLNLDAVYDASITSVDQPGDCTADFSNALVGGKFGCSFGSTAVAQTTGSSGFGRFIPENFSVTLNAPQFGAACVAGAFSDVGQPVSYATAPVMTVTARQGTANGLSNATTTNYAGAYVKLSNAGGSSLNQAPYNTQGGRYARFDALGGGTTPALDTTGLPATTADPTIGAFVNGVGTLTFGSGTGLAFTRSTTTPSAPFNADIALALNIIDTDGVTYAGNPAQFGAATAGNGIAFSGGKEMRYGRLKLNNALGSELLPLPVGFALQYWNPASGGFVTNSQDSCSTFGVANIGLANYTKNLQAGETSVSVVTFGTGASTGTGTITLAKPSGGDFKYFGSLDLVVNLGATTTPQPCPALLPATTPAGANASYLRGAWGTCTTYDRDPTARAQFGVYKGADQFIYMRENY